MTDCTANPWSHLGLVWLIPMLILITCLFRFNPRAARETLYDGSKTDTAKEPFLSFQNK